MNSSTANLLSNGLLYRINKTMYFLFFLKLQSYHAEWVSVQPLLALAHWAGILYKYYYYFAYSTLKKKFSQLLIFWIVWLPFLSPCFNDNTNGLSFCKLSQFSVQNTSSLLLSSYCIEYSITKGFFNLCCFLPKKFKLSTNSLFSIM